MIGRWRSFYDKSVSSVWSAATAAVRNGQGLALRDVIQACGHSLVLLVGS